MGNAERVQVDIDLSRLRGFLSILSVYLEDAALKREGSIDQGSHEGAQWLVNDCILLADKIEGALDFRGKEPERRVE